MSRNRHNKISGQFSTRLIEMLESPAYRILSVSAHKVLTRIEIEHAHHGGKDNGKLPVTYEHFAKYGMDRHAIGPAISELEALGFIEVTERGTSGTAFYHSPNKFRITYRPCEGRIGDGTHEWRRVETLDRAREVATAARKEPRENRSPVGVYNRRQCGKPPLKSKSPVGVFPTTVPVGVFPITSISRDIAEGEGGPGLTLPPPLAALPMAA